MGNVICCKTCRGDLVEKWQKGLEVVAINHSDMGSICHGPGGS
jgi:hypothetical protein